MGTGKLYRNTRTVRVAVLPGKTVLNHSWGEQVGDEASHVLIIPPVEGLVHGSVYLCDSKSFAATYEATDEPGVFRKTRLVTALFIKTGEVTVAHLDSSMPSQHEAPLYVVFNSASDFYAVDALKFESIYELVADK